MRRARPEDAIQRAVFQHLRARGVPGIFAFHPANGGYRKPKEAAIFKGLGVVAGTPDVIIVHSGQTYALELKRDGATAHDVTDKQNETIRALCLAGARVSVAYGLDDALQQLEDWGLLRGRAA